MSEQENTSEQEFFNDSQISQLENYDTQNTFVNDSIDTISTKKLLDNINDNNNAKNALKDIVGIIQGDANININNNESDDVSVTTLTSLSTLPPNHFEVVENSSNNFLNFLQDINVSNYFDKSKETLTKQMQIIIDAVKEPTNLTIESAKKILTKSSELLSFLKPGLNADELKKQLDEKIKYDMLNLKNKFNTIASNLGTKLNNVGKNIISEEATPIATKFIESLTNYQSEIEKLIYYLKIKDLSNNQKEQAYSLWNNFLSLDALIEQYNNSNKFLTIKEYNIMLEYVKELTENIQSLNLEYADLPDLPIQRITGIKHKIDSNGGKKTKKNRKSKGGKQNKLKNVRKSKKHIKKTIVKSKK